MKIGDKGKKPGTGKLPPADEARPVPKPRPPSKPKGPEPKSPSFGGGNFRSLNPDPNAPIPMPKPGGGRYLPGGSSRSKG